MSSHPRVSLWPALLIACLATLRIAAQSSDEVERYAEQGQQALASLAANTSIKMAGGVSTSDARALASDMRTTQDFILGQPRLTFACHIKGITPNAVSIPIPVGQLERQPRLADEAYERLRELNRLRVSRPQPARGDNFTFAKTPGSESEGLREHEFRPASSPPGDPSAPSEEW